MKKRITIVICALLVLCITVTTPAEYVVEGWWGLIDYDTLSPVNESYNMSLGKNETTLRKLFINGNLYVYGDVRKAGLPFEVWENVSGTNYPLVDTGYVNGFWVYTTSIFAKLMWLLQDLLVSGNTNISKALRVTGLTYLLNDLNVSGNTILQGLLNVSGVSNFTDDVLLSDNKGIIFGNGQDGKIYSDGTDMILENLNGDGIYLDTISIGILPLPIIRFKGSLLDGIGAMENTLYISAQSNNPQIIFSGDPFVLGVSSNIQFLGGTDTLTFTQATGGYKFDDDIIIPRYLRHDGDIDTYLDFLNDRIRLVAGNTAILDLVESTVDTAIVNANINVTGETWLNYVAHGYDMSLYIGNIAINGTTGLLGTRLLDETWFWR